MLAILAAAALVAAGGCNRAPKVLTPEEASAKGDALLKEMSKNLSSVQTFSYTAEEQREIVGTGGAKTMKHSKRDVTIRRPNGATFRGSGDSGDTQGWYDGKHITFVSAKAKMWARGPMPPTLDDALDYMASEYAVQVTSADLLYSSPYDALMAKGTTGGWVDAQTSGDRTCDHVAYKHELVDWELWLNEKRLPCQFKITYKKETGSPTSIVTYANFNLAPQVSDDTFAAKVPDGYTRIKIMRHATVEDPKLVEGEAMPAKATTGQEKPRK
jgi:hypothetical protein